MAKKFCLNCKHQGKPRMRGSFMIEVILWCFFLIPGLIYTIWRITSHRVCPRCDAPHMVPLDSPVLNK